MTFDVVVHLKDGRAIDLSGRTVDEAIAHLRALGVSIPDDIRETHHLIRDPEVLARIEAARQARKA